MIELRRLMEEGHARVYAMTARRDLFSPRDFLLEVAHGRMGWKSRRRIERFATWSALARRARELLERRRAHNYRVVAGEPETFLREASS